jgi:uncharacterized RDD family membrane protein YckC
MAGRAARRRTAPRPEAAAALLVAALLLTWCGGAAAQPRLRAASAGGHVWLIVDGDPITLMHQGRVADDLVIAAVDRSLSRWPEAVAAWGDRLCIVLAPAGGASRREVYGLDAVFNETLDRYVYAPPDRLSIMPPIEAPGTLLGLVGAPRGPVILLEPDDDREPLRLMQLADGGWDDIAAPDGLPRDGLVRLVAPSRGGSGLTVLAAGRGDRQRCTVHRRDAVGRWGGATIDLDLQAVTEATRVGDAVLLVRRIAERVRTEYELGYLGPVGMIPLTRLPTPGGTWAAVGVGDAIRVLEVPPPGPAGRARPESLTLRRVDPVSGAISPHHRMHPPPGATAVIVHQSLMLALVITVTLLALIARPGQRPAVVMPPGVAPPSPLLRLIALAIDLAPGAAVAMIALRAQPADLLRMPLLATRLTDTAPYLLMVAITAAHTTVTECASGRTLGKLVIGARVLGADGEPASPVVLLWRNLVKLTELLIPPLGLLTLLSPYLQGVHDQFARTVVVRPRRAGAEESAEDR